MCFQLIHIRKIKILDKSYSLSIFISVNIILQSFSESLFNSDIKVSFSTDFGNSTKSDNNSVGVIFRVLQISIIGTQPNV